jgi:hypothetical protein
VLTKAFLGILVFAATGLFATLPVPSVARAQHVQVRSLGDKVVDAELITYDSTGCIETDVFVVASSQRVTSVGPPAIFGPLVALSYDVSDNCNGIILRSGDGSTNFGGGFIDFFLDSGLTSAHAAATVLVTDDQHGTTFNMYVSLDWTGVGDITMQRVNQHLVTPAFSVDIVNAHGSFRNGIARGTVTDGITNFTPAPSTSAEMEVVQEAVVMIQSK